MTALGKIADDQHKRVKELENLVIRLRKELEQVRIDLHDDVTDSVREAIAESYLLVAAPPKPKKDIRI